MARVRRRRRVEEARERVRQAAEGADKPEVPSTGMRRFLVSRSAANTIAEEIVKRTGQTDSRFVDIHKDSTRVGAFAVDEPVQIDVDDEKRIVVTRSDGKKLIVPLMAASPLQPGRLLDASTTHPLDVVLQVRFPGEYNAGFSPGAALTFTPNQMPWPGNDPIFVQVEGPEAIELLANNPLLRGVTQYDIVYGRFSESVSVHVDFLPRSDPMVVVHLDPKMDTDDTTWIEPWMTPWMKTDVTDLMAFQPVGLAMAASAERLKSATGVARPLGSGSGVPIDR